MNNNLLFWYMTFSYIILIIVTVVGTRLVYKERIKILQGRSARYDIMYNYVVSQLNDRIDQIDDLDTKIFVVKNGLKQITDLVSPKSGKVTQEMATIAKEILNAI